MVIATTSKNDWIGISEFGFSDLVSIASIGAITMSSFSDVVMWVLKFLIFGVKLSLRLVS